MCNKIKNRITTLNKPALKFINKVENCEHIWLEKNGKANYICKKCKYVVSDIILDRLIFELKLKEKGFTKKHMDILKNKIK